MISVIYTFVEIPLNVAKNRDIREVGPIFKEAIHYIIDLIFFLDFIICFFRGYYNNEMDIIINNKKIFFNYIESNFLFDLLEGFPLYTLIRMLMKQSKEIHLGYSQIESISITFLLLIKPLKIFKIIKRKNNNVLEELFMFFNDNYHLERLFKFLIYFLIFFLFVHLFICLHIYFALQSYPNWLVHIDIINENFLTKYLASFYFLMTTMTTVGYGDIVCVSFIERIYHIILLVIGTLLYTFLVSKIGNYLRDQSHEQTKLDKDLNILENIRITHPNMPFKLYSKIKNHLLTIFKKRKKIGISLLINGVPDAIKNDLLFKIYSKVINGFNIFKDVKNSNFIIQMLTSFIPIIVKKEEIIFLEGEIIQNIVFVKDGRLALELVIDLNEPYKSIERYIENNFIGISREEEIKNYHSKINGQNTNVNLPEINFNDLKTRINDIINSEKATLINNSKIDNNGISMDLGRMDFTRKEAEQSQLQDLQIIKIIDIRKNEHFGDIHLFLEKPSPFTLKAKSRIAELLFLRKSNAIFMSKNFQNIWRNIETKSFHNLVSIKKLTFKILKQYLNSHYYPRTEKETNTVLNLDKNFISNISLSENYISHKVSLTKSNLNTSNIKSPNMKMNKSFNSVSRNSGSKNNTLDKIKLQSSINKKKLFVGYNSHRKNNNSIEILNDNLELSSDSLNSNSNPSSHFKVAKNLPSKNVVENQQFPIININQENDEEENVKVTNLVNNRYYAKSYKKKIIKKSSNSIFSFKNDNRSNKIIKITYTKSSTDLINNDFDSKKQSEKVLNCESFDKENTIKCSNKCLENTNINNNDRDFLIFTLEDVNKNFSKRIKKRLKKRKKIQKLKELLKLQKLKINKNLIELYLNQIMKKQNSKTKIDSNISNQYKPDNSTYSSDMRQMSQILDSNSSSEEESTQIQKSTKFEKNSLKIIVSESFKIKSSYNNINLLTKGEVIRNINYKIYLENLIKHSFNRSNVNDELSKSNYSIKTQNSKKSKMKMVKFRSGFENDSHNNNNLFLLDKISSKFNRYKHSEKTLKNYCLKILEQNDKSKNKNFYKSFERDLDFIGSLKINQNIKAQKPKNKIEGKDLLFGKKGDKNNNGLNINESCNNVTDKVVTSTLNALNEYEKDKDKDNKLAYLNQQNLNSYEKIIQKNNLEKEKIINCTVF